MEVLLGVNQPKGRLEPADSLEQLGGEPPAARPNPNLLPPARMCRR